MADGRSNTYRNWYKGFDVLKKMGCGFAAFYGAEPLADFDRLPKVVGYAESIGIHTTVITSGVTKLLKNKLGALHRAGAKSLSMSYDVTRLNRDSEWKSERAIENLLYFQGKGNIRDVAAIATLTRLNYREFLESVVELSEVGIWSFFDLIHDDRGQPGSKCKHYPGIDKLMFKEEDNADFIDFLKELKKLKDQGYLCHSSHGFMDLIIRHSELLQRYDWNCARQEGFPAWVTVDCDGIVYPCDDFQPDSPSPIQLHELEEHWDGFSKYWQERVLKDCPGCIWNTHVDAHFIKQGRMPFSDYVHTTKDNEP
jgi:MoaA/NifB/PqqE/SkfB family radical SAM enzyme